MFEQGAGVREKGLVIGLYIQMCRCTIGAPAVHMAGMVKVLLPVIRKKTREEGRKWKNGG